MTKIEEYLIQADQLLNRCFQRYSQKNSKAAVIVSGGIDSSIIAAWVSKSFSQFTLFSLTGPASKDQPFVKLLAQWLKSEVVWVDLAKLKKNSLQVALKQVKKLLVSVAIEPNLMQLSLALGCWLLFKKIAKRQINWVFSGQGPDVLFAGYHKYRGKRRVNQLIRQDLPLLNIDRRREEAIARIFGLKIIYPYLEKEFVNFALEVPARYKYKHQQEKYLLRQYGRRLSLPLQITTRPKNAFQYSTGLQKLVKTVLKEKERKKE